MGYFLLRDGLTKETPQQKMLKVPLVPHPKTAPKAYGVVMGGLCLAVGLYFLLWLIIKFYQYLNITR
jgi:hypothetical protein